MGSAFPPIYRSRLTARVRKRSSDGTFACQDRPAGPGADAGRETVEVLDPIVPAAYAVPVRGVVASEAEAGLIHIDAGNAVVPQHCIGDSGKTVRPESIVQTHRGDLVTGEGVGRKLPERPVPLPQGERLRLLPPRRRSPPFEGVQINERVHTTGGSVVDSVAKGLRALPGRKIVREIIVVPAIAPPMPQDAHRYAGFLLQVEGLCKDVLRAPAVPDPKAGSGHPSFNLPLCKPAFTAPALPHGPLAVEPRRSHPIAPERACNDFITRIPVPRQAFRSGIVSEIEACPRRIQFDGEGLREGESVVGREVQSATAFPVIGGDQLHRQRTGAFRTEADKRFIGTEAGTGIPLYPSQPAGKGEVLILQLPEIKDGVTYRRTGCQSRDGDAPVQQAVLRSQAGKGRDSDAGCRFPGQLQHSRLAAVSKESRGFFQHAVPDIPQFPKGHAAVQHLLPAGLVHDRHRPARGRIERKAHTAVLQRRHGTFPARRKYNQQCRKHRHPQPEYAIMNHNTDMTLLQR